MAIIEKKYTYEYGNDNLYNIDAYNTNPIKKSLEITNFEGSNHVLRTLVFFF